MKRDENCPTTARLADWLEGRLSDADWESCSAHIRECPACQQSLEKLPADSDTIALELRRGSSDDSDDLKMPADSNSGDTLAAPTWFHGRKSADAGDDSLVGTEFGQYRIVEKIGEGGMGRVYRAIHTRLQKVVALKVLSDAALQDAALVERFEQEMLALGRLDHPHVVGALDAGEIDGTHFLVMEFVEGENLASFVREHGPLSARSACRLIRQAATGLMDAHENGLIHRDIKPSNLMLTSGPGSRQVKVLDLGLARLPARIDGEGITSTGQVMGTVDYMAPEQAVNSRNADERSDIYSLGITLFYLLTGQAAYDGETPIEKLLAHRDAPIPDVSRLRRRVPDYVQRLFERMAAKEPTDRFQTMADVVEALDECLEQINRDRESDGPTTPDDDTDSRLAPATEVGLPATPDRSVKSSSATARASAGGSHQRLLAQGAAIVGLIAVVIFAVSQIPGGNEPPEPDADKPDQTGISTRDALEDAGWVSLFNGRGLDGWVPSGAPDDWSVQSGELVAAEDGPGWLGTEQGFADFVLELEYRLPSEGQSGVFLRCPDKFTTVGNGHLMEIQLLDDRLGEKRNIQPKGMTGAIWGHVAPTRPAPLNHDTWNELRIRAEGSQVEVAVNGESILDTDLNELPDDVRESRPQLFRPSGHVRLQQSTAGVAFRNIRIRELSAETPVSE